MGIQDTQKHISGLQRCALFLLSMMSSHLPLTSSTAFGPSDVRQTVSLHVIAHLSFQRGYQRTLESTLSRAQYSRNMEYAWVFQHFNPQVKVVRLPYDNPGDILRHFCDEIFNETSTTVLHIINPFEHFRSESAQYVSSLIRHVGLPVITWGPEYVAASNKDEIRQVQISPTLHHQAQAMLSLLDQFEWGQFSVVYTAHPGYMDFLNAIRMVIHEREKFLKKNNSQKKISKFHQLSEIEIRQTDDLQQVAQQLGVLLNTDARIILLFSSEHETRTILEAAGQHGLLGREYAWVVSFEAIPKGVGNLASHLPVGLLGVEYASNEKEMRSAVATAARIWLRALNATAYDVTSGIPPWRLPLLQCDSDRDLFWADGRRFFRYLHNATQQLSKNDIPLYEPVISIVNIQPGQDTEDNRWVQVGTWSPRGLTMNRITWFEDAQGPPTGKPRRYHLRIVTRPEEPYVIYRNVTAKSGTCEANTIPCRVYIRDHDDHKVSNQTIVKCCTGLSIDLLLKINQSLNFDVDLYEVEDFQWGNMDRHGKWDGLIRELLDGRADMAVTSLRISEDRSRTVSFSEPYLETGITIIVAIRDGAISATAFLEPYDYPSWCLILLFSVHTVGASIFVCEWLSPYGMDRGRVRLTEHKFSLFRTFWLMWAMLFGAAVSTNSPRGVSSKFLANIWALFALVFLASYTANLAAFMITKEEYYDLTGIQDWRLQNPQWMKPSFKYGTIPNTSTESNILKNNRDMYVYMQKYRQQSVQEAIYNLKTQQLHAFIYDATVLEYQAGKDADCRLITVGKWYAMSGYGIAFPVGSPWKQRVNSIILDLQTKGEMERLQEFWLAGACHMKQKKTQNRRGITGGVSSSTLGILNFTSAFILLGAGTGLATLTFLLEYFLYWFGRRRLSAWDKNGCCTLVSMSMGMSLSFQQSVHDALQLHKSYRCRKPVCENQLWKANHCLDMARLEIERLQREIAALAAEKEARAAEVWRYDPERVTASNRRTHRGGGASCGDASSPSRSQSRSVTPSPRRPNPDVYINENLEEPMCPKVTLL